MLLDFQFTGITEFMDGLNDGVVPKLICSRPLPRSEPREVTMALMHAVCLGTVDIIVQECIMRFENPPFFFPEWYLYTCIIA